MNVEGDQTAMHMHVDDGVVLAERGTGLAKALADEAADALEDVGFDVPDRKYDDEVLKAVGYEPKRSPARHRLPAEQGALLQDALRHLVPLAAVDVEVLRSLVGVWIWAVLLRRDLLCIPAAIFKFMDAYEGQVTRWWASARREAACMASAMAGLYADLGSPLARVIFATDAMGAGEDSEADCGGFGIVAKDVEPLARICYQLGRRPGNGFTQKSEAAIVWSSTSAFRVKCP